MDLPILCAPFIKKKKKPRVHHVRVKFYVTFTVLVRNINIYIYIYICRVTNCSPNLKEMDYKPNKPNTINL